MNYTCENIIEFINEKVGTDDIQPNTDLDDIVVGDDFHELIEEYSKVYSVDMSSYLWYFHANEEGFGSIGSILSRPPYKRVERIPLTPEILTNFANRGKWDMTYPEHKLPKRRYDLLVNTGIFGLLLLLIIFWVLYKIYKLIKNT